MTPSGRGGFTLLEAIVAIGILAGITGSLFLIFRNSALIQEAARHQGDMTAMGRIAMVRMEREISLAFLSSEKKNRAGGTGDNYDDTFETMFFGEDSDPFDTLNFTSRSHRKLYRDSKECSLTEVGYYEEIDRESHHFKLMHREEERIDGEPTEGGDVMVLAKGVKEFNLRYFDDTKNEWLDEWDTAGMDQLNRLPRSVEVTLVIADDEGEEWSWVTKVHLKARN